MPEMTTTEQPPTNQRTSARVTYQIVVNGTTTNQFTADITVTGSAAEAAMKLCRAVCDDAQQWLGAQSTQIPRRVPAAVVVADGLLRRRRLRVMPVPETARSSRTTERGSVAATIEVDGKSHDYTAEFSTVGNPFRAAGAALNAAREDLWSWAWDMKNHR